MSLITTTQMLRDAQKGGYAIGAFNVENAEMVRAVCAAAKSADVSAILQTTSSTLKYLNCQYFAGLARAAAEEFDIDVALHLDHGSSYDLACACIDAGYTSVMIDGSKLPFEENIQLSARVVEYAHAHHVPVEAELGTVGGKEDETESAGNQYTDPVQAAEFVRRTQIDSLAIAFGTAHGFYQTPPVLDLARVALVREKVSIPLVMHGTSGVAPEDVRVAIRNGICKVNFATELRATFSDGIRAYMKEDPQVVDPKLYLGFAQTCVAKLVEEHILHMKCTG